MSAGFQEHPGNEAGRVTLVTTLLSVLPTFIVAGFIAVAFVIELLPQEIAGPMFLTALGLGGAVTGTVFASAKKTKTDRADVVWGSPPVADLNHPLEAPLQDFVEDPDAPLTFPVEDEKAG